MVDFSKPFKPFILTERMCIGQGALCFQVGSINEAAGTVTLTDPSCTEDHPLLKQESDSDWVDWGDDFDMPDLLFDMMFGAEPKVGMVVVMFRPLP